MDKNILEILDGKNINFLIGSGASHGAFDTLSLGRNDEMTFEDLLNNKKLEQGSKKVLMYIFYYKYVYKMSKYKYLEDNRAVFNNYVKFIEILADILTTRSYDRPKRANIFTTNYDLFFEYAFEEYLKNKSNCFFNDGSVGFINKYLNNGWFNLLVSTTGYVDFYKRDIPTINLYKMHGSVSWIKDNDRIKISYLNDFYEEFGIKNIENVESLFNDLKTKSLLDINAELLTVYKENKNDLDKFREDYMQKSAIINPTNYKFEETILQEHYYQTIRSFCYELEKENSVLFVFGFSFADQHILEMFKRIMNNPTLEIFIICYDENAKAEIEKKLGNNKNISYIPDFSNNNVKGNFDFLNDYLLNNIDEKGDKVNE